MMIAERFDKIITGVISGFVLPLITALIIYLFAEGDPKLFEWFVRIFLADITTHIITLSVFSNIIIFLIFNHYDMLRAARGVLGITIAWAVLVFVIKFLI
jgi:hypothetical protein